MTDPIADLLTRIRNAQCARHTSVTIPYSRLKHRILEVMSAEGYIAGFEVLGEVPRKHVVVQLKYVVSGGPVITGLQRVSTPGRRTYGGYKNSGAMKKAMGIVVLSTPRGVMTDSQAREQKVGGEILCQVW
jgi:small subunit ribosomal protein S8